jgi:hypothetical protein
MPSYLDILPCDIQTLIYKHLYTSILKDMKNIDHYKNIIYFHKLLEIADNPLFDNLDFLGMININNNKYDILKYKKNKTEYYELFQKESAIYNKSYYTKKLDIIVDNILISNYALYSLYKANKNYYITIISMINTYLNVNNFNMCDNSIITQRISKANFILQKSEPFKCLAELLYYIIDFYNIIKDVIYKNIELLEDIENTGQVLTRRQHKDKYIFEDMRNYHINNNFITRLDYDIDNKIAVPVLCPL